MTARRGDLPDRAPGGPRPPRDGGAHAGARPVRQAHPGRVHIGLALPVRAVPAARHAAGEHRPLALGPPATSPSGTTARPSITPSTTTATCPAGCTASRSPAISRSGSTVAAAPPCAVNPPPTSPPDPVSHNRQLVFRTMAMSFARAVCAACATQGLRARRARRGDRLARQWRTPRLSAMALPSASGATVAALGEPWNAQ